MYDMHTCSYSCDRPECIRQQRDELAVKLAQQPVAAPGIDLQRLLDVWREEARASGPYAESIINSHIRQIEELIDASPEVSAPVTHAPAGRALVRTEPTAAMLDAGIDEIDYGGGAGRARRVWLAMLEAAGMDSPKGDD